MIKAAPAFNIAKSTDPHYNLLVQNPKMFWKVHFRKIKDYTPSDEIVDLISKMLDYDSDRRITLDGIKESEWYNGPVPTQEEVILEMTARRNGLEDEMEVDQ